MGSERATAACPLGWLAVQTWVLCSAHSVPVAASAWNLVGGLRMGGMQDLEGSPKRVVISGVRAAFAPRNAGPGGRE